MKQDFGQVIKQARKDRGLSQKELAQRIGLDFTYLSKLENNRADYAPKEEVIRLLAKELTLDPEELIFLAGRIPRKDEEFLMENYRNMPTLFRRMRENPDFAREIFDAAMKEETRKG